jgi:TetR/AcrR family transcriptional regulator, transcriptional repressor for nem operon
LTQRGRTRTYQPVRMQPRASKRSRNAPETRRQLIDATTRLMLRHGFAATTVDQICAEARLTKGSFFHHFETKEAIAREAMETFAQAGMGLYAAACVTPTDDPLKQLHRLLDIMSELAQGHPDPITCMVGMLSQEMAATNSSMREACVQHMNAWTEMVTRLLANAKTKHRPRVDLKAEDVAWMLYSIWQGSMLIGKTRQDSKMIVRNLRHARAYVNSLFADSPSEFKTNTPTEQP